MKTIHKKWFYKYYRLYYTRKILKSKYFLSKKYRKYKRKRMSIKTIYKTMKR